MTNLLPVFHKIEQNKKKLISNLFGSKKVELVKYGHKLLKLTTHPSRWKKKNIFACPQFWTNWNSCARIRPKPTDDPALPIFTLFYFKKKMENREPKDG